MVVFTNVNCGGSDNLKEIVGPLKKDKLNIEAKTCHMTNY